ncbi:hypothetical protein GCM10023185_23730 [Hymenobacter saemangeumensis]|uniref:2-dehydro-3-deoxyphosphooctonate aldolase n=1 Tax=Hymenobacter saemangeumensis TaxID=1084522 RepID=A0ABP8IG82_9BACT
MKNSLLCAWGVVALLCGCASQRPAAAPPLLGSTSLPGAYYENARQTVTPFVLQEVSTDETYGYSPKNPVNVGGVAESGARNQQRYLNALRGPEGQPVTYTRRGSCCPFKTPNGFIDNIGMLDAYSVSWAGQDKPVVLYLNFYDEGWLKAPKGFTLAK